MQSFPQETRVLRTLASCDGTLRRLMRNLTGFARSNPKSRRKIARHPFRLPPTVRLPFFLERRSLPPKKTGQGKMLGKAPSFPMHRPTAFFSPGRYNLSTRCINHQVSQVTGGIIHGNERKSGGRLLRFPPTGYSQSFPAGLSGSGGGGGGIPPGGRAVGGGDLWALCPLRCGGGGGGRVGAQRVLHPGGDLPGLPLPGGDDRRHALRSLGHFDLLGGLCLL